MLFLNGTIIARLFVSSYIGTISTLQLSKSLDGSYALNTIAVNNVTTDNPSWLQKDPHTGVLYCLNEGFSGPNGSISSFEIAKDGSLSLLQNSNTSGGPVSSILFNKGKSLAVAHYGGASITTHHVQANGTLLPLQTLTFNMSGPGPNAARQDKPHPHQVVLDPTEKFIVTPDLGADLVRVFSIDHKTALLTEQAPYKAPPASGPRHGAFHKAESGETYYHLVSEIANTVTSFEVTYNKGQTAGLTFKQIDNHGIYGNQTTPAGAAAAACLVTPDGRQILTSSRNATILSIPQPPAHPTNNTPGPSDTLQVWNINTPSNSGYAPEGSLSFSQLFPSGGVYPRQMSLNKAGTLLAVSLQRSARVVILERDVKTGLLVKFLADVQVGNYSTPASLDGQLTSVIWDDEAECQK
ncbi:hypothetical protein DSL72_005812 [Monilinia vaccinii-corymbosi]|uniref:6-phosphogluconolactonase n=1 Tax=Monilinia vaccinii-corymbosi TaxID=61207 RepID=A0A8A3PG42_9HELO|nr:hypothetical protein DSL72_005812 [Monilinia vaccinii-corymbosi]